MADKYTHDFKFELNDSFIRGEVELGENIDLRIKIWSEPLSAEAVIEFAEWINSLKKLHTDKKRIIKDISVFKKKEKEL